MSEVDLDAILEHHGIKGMHWGVRRDRETDEKKAFRKETNKIYKKNYQDDALDTRLRRSFGPGMTAEEYAKLSTKDVVIRKGSTVYRVTGTKAKKNDAVGPLFVSTSQKDRDIYRAVMPQVNQPFRRRNYDQQEFTFKTLDTLKSPSEKERVDAFISLMDTPKVTLNNGKTITGRELLQRQGYGHSVKKMDATRLGLKYYNDFVAGQGMKNAPMNSAYFKTLSEKGYNAIVDDNDRKIISHEPLIVLDRGVLKNTGVQKLSDEDIFNAKRTIKAPTKAPTKAKTG